MPITSLLVKVAEDPVKVAEHISEFPATEVTDIKKNTLVVVTETTSVAEDKAIWQLLENAPGVSGLTAIYHNFEDIELNHDGCFTKGSINV